GATGPQGATGSATGSIFFAQLAYPAVSGTDATLPSPSYYYVPLSGGGFSANPATSTNWDAVATPMPAACSFDRLYVEAAPTSTSPAPTGNVTITVTLYKTSTGGGTPQ